MYVRLNLPRLSLRPKAWLQSQILSRSSIMQKLKSVWFFLISSQLMQVRHASTRKDIGPWGYDNCAPGDS